MGFITSYIMIQLLLLSLVSLKHLYGADNSPTEFVSGGAIETEALAQGGALASVVQVFMKKLSSENYS